MLGEFFNLKRRIMRTNLIIDGHSLMNVAARTCLSILVNSKATSYNDINDLIIEDEGSFIPVDDFKRMYHDFLVDYLNSITRPLSNYLNHFFIVFDAGNTWRNQIFDKYKSDRKQKRKQSNFESKLQSLFPIFKNDVINLIPNINTLSIKGLEGDDLISLIINNDSTNNYIIWSADNDLKQLLNFNYYPHYRPNLTMIMSPTKSKGRKQLQVTSNLENINNTQLINLIDQICNNKFTVKYNHPEAILIEKIIKGDKSDSIVKFYQGLINNQYTDKQVSRRINKEVIKPLYSEFSVHELINLSNNVINKIIDSISPYLLDSDSIDEAKSNLELNRQLVQLSENNIFQELVRQFHEVFSYYEQHTNNFNYHQDLANNLKNIKYNSKK